MHKPVVLFWWLGLLPAVLPLFFYDQFNVGIASQSYPAGPAWLICYTMVIFTAGVFDKTAALDKQVVAVVPLSVVANLRIVGFLLLSVSIAANYWIISKVGNPYGSDNPEADRLALDGGGSGVLLAIGFSALLIGISCSAAGIFWRGQRLGGFTLFLGGLLTGVATYTMALTGTRSIAVYALVAALVVASVSRFRRVPAKLVLPSFGGLLLLIGYIGQLRYRGESLSIGRLLGDRLSSDIQGGGLIYNLANSDGFWFGKAIVLPFGTYAPGSQPGLGTELKNSLNLQFSGGGISTPLPVEGYLDFGWVGVVLYGCLAGAVLAGLGAFAARYVGPFALVFSVGVGVILAGLSAGLGTSLATFVLPTFIVATAALGAIKFLSREPGSDNAGEEVDPVIR